MSEGHEELITSGPSRLASVKQYLEFESESVASHWRRTRHASNCHRPARPGDPARL